MRRISQVAALLALPSLLAAQEPPRPTPVQNPAPAAADSARAPALPQPSVGPPIEKIATATQMSTTPLGSILSVQELPDGRVLVNDGQRRRLLLMDSTLQHFEVVLDSLAEVANTYGTRPGALLPYKGDTTLFVDPASYAMIVIDPAGKPVRVRSVWRAQEAGMISSPFFGIPGIDAQGRIVYRMQALPAPPTVAPPAGIPWIPSFPDSAFIVAVDIDTRKLDTIAAFRIPKQDMRARRDAEGRIMIDQVVNPMPLTDDWAVLPDGTVAILRGLDYRIDYLNPDGSWSSSPKLPYEWVRMLEDDKERFADSVRTSLQNQILNQWASQVIRWVNMYSRDYPEGFTVPPGFVPQPGFPRDWILPPGVTFPENYVYACAPGQSPPAGGGMPGMAMPMPMPGAAAPAGAAAPGGAPQQPPCMPAPVFFSSGVTPPMPQPRMIHVLPASDLPDYKPPIAVNALRADMEGNLWIRANQAKPVPGGPVYDIVNRQGELVTRYQLPPGYTIVGFGRGRVVYLSMRDATGLKLARVRLR